LKRGKKGGKYLPMDEDITEDTENLVENLNEKLEKVL
jgi:hypothetical protein